MSQTVIYPGTFDPITNGHIEIITRALKLFDRVIVAVAHNVNKQPLFSLERRVGLAQAVLADYPQIEVHACEVLLVDFARAHQARVILRGLRAMSDFEYEFQLATMNQAINSDIETVFLTPSSQSLAISSTLVRDIASYGGDVSRFVPPAVDAALKQHCK